jgi:hypothetical protein
MKLFRQIRPTGILVSILMAGDRASDLMILTDSAVLVAATYRSHRARAACEGDAAVCDHMTTKGHFQTNVCLRIVDAMTSFDGHPMCRP